MHIPRYDFFKSHRCRLSEASLHYPCLKLNPKWRVITCSEGVQWVLQRLHSGTERAATARWEGRSYCRTREILIRCCRAYCGEIDPVAAVALATLPERIEPTRHPKISSCHAPSGVNSHAEQA